MKRFLLLVVTSLTLPFTATAGQLEQTRFERTTYLPIGPGGGNAERRVIYSVGPLDIPQGSIVDIRFQAQLTNDCGSNVGVGRTVVRTNLRTNVNGVYVTPPAIENITPGEHHAVLTQSTIERATEDIDDAFYNVVMYAISSAAICTGSTISVDGSNSESGGELVVEVR
jgi:hypothetical protein